MNDLSLSIKQRRDLTIYLIITAIFIGSLCIINVINVTRFLEFDLNLGFLKASIILPISILPYPLTFLCTDIVSECYGRKAANQLVTTGLIANLTVLIVLWLSGLPEPLVPDEKILISQSMESHFFLLRYLTISSIISSMIAYLVSQYLDVMLFHYFKRITNDKYLWFRNNASTIISQWVDTCLVFGCVYLLTKKFAWANEESPAHLYPLMTVILCGYGYKFLAALVDTFPCYFFVWLIKRNQ